MNTNTENPRTPTTIFGIRPVIEALEAGKTLDKVFIHKGLRGENVAELMRLLKTNGILPKIVPQEKLDRLTGKNHQGVFAFISAVDFADLEYIVEECSSKGKNILLLMLDHLTDVRNFGAIIRTAECTGVDAIIIPREGMAPVNADTVKTSTGAIFRVPICRVANLTDTLYFLRHSGIQAVAATEKTDNLLYNTDFKLPTVIIMGNEEKGISNQLLKACDRRAKLPLAGTIGSLNVSVAAGAMLYEAVRQRLL